MKKIMNKINFALIAIMASVPAFAESKITVSKDACELFKSMHDVFNILRTLAFIGAAFYIAGWAWGYIANAGSDKGFSVEDIKKKGTGLLVGFTLLFIIGLVLSFVMSAAGMNLMGCEIIKKW